MSPSDPTRSTTPNHPESPSVPWYMSLTWPGLVWSCPPARPCYLDHCRREIWPRACPPKLAAHACHLASPKVIEIFLTCGTLPSQVHACWLHYRRHLTKLHQTLDLRQSRLVGNVNSSLPPEPLELCHLTCLRHSAVAVRDSLIIISLNTRIPSLLHACLPTVDCIGQ